MSEDKPTGIWESTDLLTSAEVAEDQTVLVGILNGLPDKTILVSATFVLPNGRKWMFRMLPTAVVV